jgi:hypothetical protein
VKVARSPEQDARTTHFTQHSHSSNRSATACCDDSARQRAAAIFNAPIHQQIEDIRGLQG